EHSSVEALPDQVTLGNVSNLSEQNEALVKQHLGEYGDFDDDIFSSFNTALLRDGAFIHVPEGVKVETPVQLLFVQTDAEEPYFTTSRCLIWQIRIQKSLLLKIILALVITSISVCRL